MNDGATGLGTTAVTVESSDASVDAEEVRLRRRIGAIWILLLFNCLPWVPLPTILAIPPQLSKFLTMGALVVALGLAMSVNPRLQIRPNAVLGLLTVLAVITVVVGIRGTIGVGAVFRSFRFLGFLTVLWLLTPWWGRRDMLLGRCHLRALTVVCGSVVVGLLISPATALGGPQGRLIGTIWPIPPPAVGQFAAVTAGIVITRWLCGSMRGSRALVLGLGGVALLLLSHTRTALIAAVAGLVCVVVSLFLSRRRVRRFLTVTVTVTIVATVLLAPAFSRWFVRGQERAELDALTGRRDVWAMLLNTERPEFNKWFGFGLSEKSFTGRPIDSTWLSVYQDAGLVGAGVVGALLLFLMVTPASRPPGEARAVAVFLVVYCAISSYTEVGLGDASPYILHLVAAASLLASPPRETAVLPAPGAA